MGIKQFFYVRTLQNIEVALLDMFNNIYINRYTGIDRKTIVKTLKVPILTFTEKNFLNWYENISLKRPLLPLPISGLKLNGLTRNDKGRTQSTYLRNILSKASDQWLQDMQPTPYTASYSLEYLMTLRSDLGQIVENILPYFNPNRALRIKEFSFMPDIPDLERKIQVELVSNTITFNNELKNDSTHTYINFKVDLKLEIELYRPLEFADIIKYAGLNINVDNLIDSQQALVYPTDIINNYSKPFTTISTTDETGVSILKANCKTLIQEIDTNGNITYTDISPSDCADIPTNVPDIKQLDLWFTVDSDNEPDHSPYQRNFTLLNLASRTFIDGGGENVSGGGYEVDPSVSWNNILTWYGTNDGLNQSPFTFRIKVQFNDANVTDAVFQELKNKVTDSIPEGAVNFEWGVKEGKLYFIENTYGTNALNYTFQTQNIIDLNNTDVYTFIFVLYDSGRSGQFGYTINDQPTIALITQRN